MEYFTVTHVAKAYAENKIWQWIRLSFHFIFFAVVFHFRKSDVSGFLALLLMFSLTYLTYSIYQIITKFVICLADKKEALHEEFLNQAALTISAFSVFLSVTIGVAEVILLRANFDFVLMALLMPILGMSFSLLLVEKNVLSREYEKLREAERRSRYHTSGEKSLFVGVIMLLVKYDTNGQKKEKKEKVKKTKKVKAKKVVKWEDSTDYDSTVNNIDYLINKCEEVNAHRCQLRELKRQLITTKKVSLYEGQIAKCMPAIKELFDVIDSEPDRNEVINLIEELLSTLGEFNKKTNQNSSTVDDIRAYSLELKKEIQ